ncbi:MAG: hypothetical protein WDW38_000814 [Sanguina aurantia]
MNGLVYNASPEAAALQKPGYHITPQGGWCNDPNAPFQYNSSTHVFFQHNPVAPVWARPYWSHVVSKDLVHWKRLPWALSPDRWWDADGVFSGSATIDPATGAPFVIYTGVNNFTNLGYYSQVSAAAIPADPSDPDLAVWIKPPEYNPLNMDLPFGGDPSQFRDPTTAWFSPGGDPSCSSGSKLCTGPGGGDSPPLWYTIVGAQVDCVGSAAMFSSPDLKNWSSAGTLFSQLAYNFSAARQCLEEPAPSGPTHAKDFGGQRCNQFGYCHMYECPDYFQAAPGVLAFKWSDQVWGRQPFSADFYILGSADTNFTIHQQFETGQDMMRPVLDGDYFSEQYLDYGAVYASKSFLLEDGRRLWLGWVYEDSVGCSESCAKGTPFTEQMGWQGMQTLPREVVYDPETHRLQFQPLRELTALRSKQLFSGLLGSSNLSHTASTSGNSSHGAPAASVLWDVLPMQMLSPTEAARTVNTAQERRDYPYTLSAPLVESAALRRQMDVDASFLLKLPAGASGVINFEVGITLWTGPGQRTRFLLNGTGSPQPASRCSPPTAPAAATTTSTLNPSADPSHCYVTHDLAVWADRSESGGLTNTSISHGGPVDLPTSGLDLESSLPLRVLIDHSVVEVYALVGRGRVTSRVYSLEAETAWGLQVFGRVGGSGFSMQAQVQVYEMDSCWVTD